MTDFYNLPENVSIAILQDKFIEFLMHYANNTTKENIIFELDELLELADRQWNTYEILDDEIKSQIEKYLISIIDFANESIMESVLSIIPRLGLENIFLYIISKKHMITNKNIVQDIMESEAEYGKTVSNPYSDL